MYKYLVFVNQITPTWQMCQFMLCTIPSFIQHRIQKFLNELGFYEFCKFYEDFWKQIVKWYEVWRNVCGVVVTSEAMWLRMWRIVCECFSCSLCEWEGCVWVCVCVCVCVRVGGGSKFLQNGSLIHIRLWRRTPYVFWTDHRREV